MKIARLGDVCDFTSGGTPSKSNDAYFQGDIPWITGADIVGPVAYDARSFITPEAVASSATSVAPAGTVLLVTRTSVGKVAVAGRDIAFSQDITALNPKAGAADSAYVRHMLRVHQPSLERQARGATIKGVTRRDVTSLVIPLPPLDEQRRIAAILDKADELRSKRRQALAHLDTLTQSIFHSTFGAYLEASNSTVSQTGTVQLGRQRAPKYQTGKYTRPYMRVANVKLNALDLDDVLEMDFNESDFESYRLNHGDILLNEGQSTELVGRPAIWRNEIEDCCFQNTLVRYVADPQQIVPEFALATFLYYFDRGEFARISSKTSSIAHLGAARFARMPMPTPPLELQQTFASRIAAVERLKENHRKHLAELDALFASLQHRAFKGEL
ncbi:restriction endonuclease subunit S [Arthrobacter cavernae]|uniref:Restriction endonuclease subunit S n=1 Tax=Arthrobacter cavernae TaxID=2817681 RepID=A0A939HHD7_9MICC|nr:restriction endonuclease subunit S [Arthrobacter cavernae]MBO1268308.1 restriction endonuclease subunit S [Arthrobacter cavernae]